MNTKTSLKWGIIATLAMMVFVMPSAAWTISASYGYWNNYWNGNQWVTPGAYPYGYGYHGYDYGYYYAPTYYVQADADIVYPRVANYNNNNNIVYVQQPQPYVTTSYVTYSGSSSGSSQGTTQSHCGDGWCTASQGETISTCPADCTPAAYCGDGACNNGETSGSCPHDCTSTATASSNYCGDGSCSGAETQYSCPEDCGLPNYCGDGTCAGAETRYNCAEDCGLAPYCGDGSCNGAESKYNCATDCGLPPYCGNGACDNDETKYSCSLDCGMPSCSSPNGDEGDTNCEDREILRCTSGVWRFSYSVQCCDTGDCPSGYTCSSGKHCELSSRCGDGRCNGDENQYNCPSDCRSACPSCAITAYCGDNICNNGETQYTCPQDCGTPLYCGDRVCNNGETQSTCPQDCGTPSYCGDGTCNLNTETQYNCPQDCGAPARHAIELAVIDECHEIEQGDSGAFTLMAYNNGNVAEELTITTTGSAALWATQPYTVIVQPGASESWQMVISVPEGATPGLYSVNVSARNGYVADYAIIHTDVKLPPLENATPVEGGTGGSEEGTDTGSDIVATGPTGAVVLGDIVIPEWFVIFAIFAAGAAVLLVIITRSSSSAAASRLTVISQKAASPGLATDGGERLSPVFLKHSKRAF